jgi:hypothetical protein
MDTTLKLDSITFQGFEIPEQITLGGAQALVVHKLPGGDKVVQSMGREDDSIPWSGMFLGSDALDRARAVDTLRIQGVAVFFSFMTFNYSVKVKKFTFTVEAFYRVLYTIELEVIQDFTQQNYSSQQASVTDAIYTDSSSAVVSGAAVGDSPLRSALATMDSTIKSVSDFAKATQSTINTVLAPISAVQQRVTTLIASASNTLINVTTLGGILPNTPIAQQAAKLSGQVAAATQLPILYNLQSTVGRISTNLNLINSQLTSASQTVAGGTLFDVATKAYGDPTKYVAIAQANGLTDTSITTVQTLTIPNNPANNDGIPT